MKTNSILKFSVNGDSEKVSAIETFQKLILSITELLAQRDVNVKPFSEESLAILPTFLTTEIESMNRKLQNEYDFILNTIKSKKTSNREVIKNILSFINVTVPKDYLKTIEEEDIIEIYDTNHVQIYRNIKFYTTTTYALSDLLVFPWMELYFRSSTVATKVLDLITASLVYPSNDVVIDMKDAPIHYIKEIKASPVQLCEVRFKHVSPVIDTEEKKSGYIISCQAKSLLGELNPNALTFI